MKRGIRRVMTALLAVLLSAFTVQAAILVDFGASSNWVTANANGRGLTTNTWKHVPFSMSLARSPTNGASGYTGPVYYGGATGNVSMTGWAIGNSDPDYISASGTSTGVGSKVTSLIMFTNQSSTLTQVVYSARPAGSAGSQTNTIRIVIRKTDGAFYISESRGGLAGFTATITNPGALLWYNYNPATGITGIGSQASGLSLTNVDAVGEWIENRITATNQTTVMAGISVFQAWSTLLQSQTISFPNPGNQIITNSVMLSATALSGLPVTYGVVSGPAALNGSNVTFTGAGSVTLSANQSGNGVWDPAPQANVTFTVSGTNVVVGTASPVALWAFPYGRDVSNTVHLGVVAYQQNGVTQVVFQVGGGALVTVTNETLNPETGEMEFVLTLNTTGYTDGSNKVSATAWGGGRSNALPVRPIWVANSTTNKIYYVATNGSDVATNTSGSSSSPFASISNAVAKASSGDEIRVRNGDYVLNLDMKDRNFTRYVLIRADDGATPRIIPPSYALRSGFLRFKGLLFDWRGVATNRPDNGVDGNIIVGWGKPYVWFEDCSFQGPPGKYNSYLIAIKLYSDARDITVERCEFHDLNVALPMPFGSIARNNYIHDITSDAFDFNSDTLITGNRIHGILAPKLFMETTNAGPFNIAGLGLSFLYCELNNGIYTNFSFPDLGALVTNPVQATALDLAQGFMADGAFSNKLSASASNGYLRVTARRSNYLQHLYVTNTANQVLGFKYDSVANQAEGSGQHADVFQTWGVAPDYAQSNVVIRNNQAYEVDSQGLLPQVDLSNLVFVNNLLNMFGDSWVMYFESSYKYRNIMMVHNTLWGRGNSLILAMTNDPVDFLIANNIFGARAAIGDKVRPGLTMDYNLYDYYSPGGGETNAAHSLWTNPAKLDPTATPLFLSVTSFFDSAVSSFTSYAAPDGDFSLRTNSPARDAGSHAFGIRYDVNWNLRGTAADMGCYEYVVPGADTDSDGMPDNWELWNGFSPFDPADALQDADGDGYGNFNEYVAGTDPFNSGSGFAAEIGPDGMDMRLSFPSVSNRFYSAEWCESLLTTNWQILTSKITGNGGLLSILDTNPADSRFYRLQVFLP
jgi:hypothetical protein